MPATGFIGKDQDPWECFQKEQADRAEDQRTSWRDNMRAKGHPVKDDHDYATKCPACGWRMSMVWAMLDKPMPECTAKVQVKIHDRRLTK